MTSNLDDETFRRLHVEVSDVGRVYEGVIFIGGIAVYLHAINHETANAYAQSTHDAGFYICLSSLSDLREIEELTPNSRLFKHEFKRQGEFSFDVYAQRQSSLPVPYDEVAAYAVQYDGVTVADLEDLLTLKLEAAAARHHSEHGRKDAKDVIRILLLATVIPFDFPRAVGYMQERHLERLGLIVKGPEFNSLADGNLKVAKALRQKATKVYEGIHAAFDQVYGKEY